MKERWELECAYHATQRFRVILQTAKQKQFRHFGKFNVLQIWAALWLWPHMCGASDPPRHWGELYKRSTVQSGSNSSCRFSSTSGEILSFSFLLSPLIFYFIICKLYYWQVLGSRPWLGALNSVILILFFPSLSRLKISDGRSCKMQNSPVALQLIPKSWLYPKLFEEPAE